MLDQYGQSGIYHRPRTQQNEALDIFAAPDLLIAVSGTDVRALASVRCCPFPPAQSHAPLTHRKKNTLHSRQNGASAPAQAVLIVGTGPAGLFAACELLRHGVMPRVVERRLTPHHETRGTALQPAVLDIIDRGGLIEPFLHAGVRIREIQLLGPGLQEIVSAKFAGIGCH